jgi:hypothetical protein
LLAALAILSAQQLATLRSWGVVKLLQLAMPGEETLDGNTSCAVWACCYMFASCCVFQAQQFGSLMGKLR